MARRRSRNGVVRVQVPEAFYEPIRVRTAMQLLEDRRLFHPAGPLRAPRSFFMRPRLIVAAPKRQPRLNKRSMSLPSKVGFDIPDNVAICVRRHVRREVIIAKKLARNGGGAKHRNIWSDVRC